MKRTVAVVAFAALAGCAAPGSEPVPPMTDADFRSMVIEEARAARGAPMRGLRLTDLLLPPSRDPRH